MRALGNAFVCLGVLAQLWLVPAANAEIKDYEFVLLNAAAKADDVILRVALLNKRTGAPVPDAVVFAKRADMAPDGMPEMDTPLDPMPSEEPGVYRFAAFFPMEGKWELSFAAKVQGEAGTVTAKLTLQVVR